jgi:hypothetical protein
VEGGIDFNIALYVVINSVRKFGNILVAQKIKKYMYTKFENRIPGIEKQLQHANGYLEAESIVIANLKEQLKDGVSMSAIDKNLEVLYEHINKIVVEKNKDPEVVNFKYASACLKRFITTPYWHSWIEIVD